MSSKRKGSCLGMFLVYKEKRTGELKRVSIKQITSLSGKPIATTFDGESILLSKLKNYAIFDKSTTFDD